MPSVSESQLSPTILQRHIDWGSGTVTNGGAATVTLRPQSLAVLKFLAERPGVLVTKDELMEAVWPNIAVTDDSLVQCVTEIRKALGDDAHVIIKTVPKRGYVFEAGAHERAARKRPYLAAALAATLAIALIAAYLAWPDLRPAEIYRPGVAVLPFTNLSGDGKLDKLANGLTEDVITDLSRFGHLNVIARHSVEAYRGKAADMRDVGKALGVQYAIEGSLQQEGQTLRVTAQLIDAANGGHLWAQRWDRTDTRNISLQNEVASSVAVEAGGIFDLGAIIQAEAAKARRKAVETRSVHEHFMIAVDAKARWTKESNAESMAAINRALTLDPGMAIGYATRGWLHFHSTDFDIAWKAGLAAMGADMKKAFDLDPHDANVLSGYAYYLTMVDRLPEAETLIREAIARNPNDSHVLCVAAMVLPYTGDPDDARIYADRKLVLDPHAEPSNRVCAAEAYYFARRFDAAVKIMSRIPPDKYGSFKALIYAASLAFVGRDAEAESAKAALLKRNPGVTAQQFYSEDWYFAREQERKLFFDGFRALKLPMCATAEQLKLIAKPEPLPECPAMAGG